MTRAQGNASHEARKGMRRKVLITGGSEAFRRLWENRGGAVEEFESIYHEIKILFEQSKGRNEIINPVVASEKLPRTEVWAEDDPAVKWAGAFAAYGGHGGATASSTIVYEIEPGARLGLHNDATEETQYIIAGTGTLYMEDGSHYPVEPGHVFVLPTLFRPRLATTA